MIPTVLATLVGIADLLIQDNKKERAAYALAFVMQHPQSSAATRNCAEAHFYQLEAELCPRVILDAKTQAETTTLNQIIDEFLEEEPQ